jgi:hypothetical protein
MLSIVEALSKQKRSTELLLQDTQDNVKNISNLKNDEYLRKNYDIFYDALETNERLLVDKMNEINSGIETLEYMKNKIKETKEEYEKIKLILNKAKTSGTLQELSIQTIKRESIPRDFLTRRLITNFHNNKRLDFNSKKSNGGRKNNKIKTIKNRRFKCVK